MLYVAQVSKPVLLGKMNKCRSLQETDRDHNNATVAVENTHQPRAAKMHSSPKDKASQIVVGYVFNVLVLKYLKHVHRQKEQYLINIPHPVSQLYNDHFMADYVPSYVFHHFLFSNPGYSEGNPKYIMYLSIHH